MREHERKLIEALKKWNRGDYYRDEWSLIPNKDQVAYLMLFDFLNKLFGSYFDI
jgi:hypothetical protein